MFNSQGQHATWSQSSDAGDQTVGLCVWNKVGVLIQNACFNKSRADQGQQSHAAEKSTLPQRDFVINRHDNLNEGHIAALVSWEAPSHKAARE